MPKLWREVNDAGEWNLEIGKIQIIGRTASLVGDLSLSHLAGVLGHIRHYNKNLVVTD